MMHHSYRRSTDKRVQNVTRKDNIPAPHGVNQHVRRQIRILRCNFLLINLLMPAQMVAVQDDMLARPIAHFPELLARRVGKLRVAKVEYSGFLVNPLIPLVTEPLVVLRNILKPTHLEKGLVNPRDGNMTAMKVAGEKELLSWGKLKWVIHTNHYRGYPNAVNFFRPNLQKDERGQKE